MSFRATESESRSKIYRYEKMLDLVPQHEDLDQQPGFCSVGYKNFILQALFQSAQHLYEKRGSVPLTYVFSSGFRKAQKHADPDPQHWFFEHFLVFCTLFRIQALPDLPIVVYFFLFYQGFC